jgi:D-alanyl-D-alanine carboxypeptidase
MCSVIRKYRSRITRVIIYSLLTGLLGITIHIYVVYPLYVTKIPYFMKAVGAGFDIECEGEGVSQLKNIIRYVGLPFFALDNRIIYLSKTGHPAQCWTTVGGNGETGSTFPLASMTKVLTAFVTLNLIQRNESLTLDTKLLDFFPEVDRQSIEDSRLLEVDLENLLSHSSGFGGPFGFDDMVERGVQTWCPYRPYKLTSITLAGKPGENYVYSNVAYCLLGEIIAKESGLGYVNYVEKEYLKNYDSLGFLTKNFNVEKPKYDYSNEQLFGPDYINWLDLNALAPAAGLTGNPLDFAKMIHSLFGEHPEILSIPQIIGCGSGKIQNCYSATLKIHNLEAEQRIGIQQGYLPGASSLLAISSRGEVLVWTSAGAPLEHKYRSILEKRVVAFLKNP